MILLRCLQFIGDPVEKDVEAGHDSDGSLTVMYDSDGIHYPGYRRTNRYKDTMGEGIDISQCYKSLEGVDSEFNWFDFHVPPYFLMKLGLADMNDESSDNPHGTFFVAVRMFQDTYQESCKRNAKTKKLKEDIANYKNEEVTVTSSQKMNSRHYYILPGDGVVPIGKVTNARFTFFTRRGREELLSYFNEFYLKRNKVCCLHGTKKVDGDERNGSDGDDLFGKEDSSETDDGKQHPPYLFVPKHFVSGLESESQWNSIHAMEDIQQYYSVIPLMKDHTIPGDKETVGAIQRMDLGNPHIEENVNDGKDSSIIAMKP
jgi:hypothetical protein